MTAKGSAADGTLTSCRGNSLFFQVAMPEQSPQAAVVIVHGFAEYSGRYTAVIEGLQKAGCAVLSFDLQGHGRSEGRRGHILRFDDYLDDLDQVLRTLAERTADAPLFLLGHSLGALIVALYLAERKPPLTGAVLSSPFIGFAIKVPGWKAFLGNALSRLLPSFSLPNGIDAADLSHDPAVVERYRTDPLIHHVASTRWFTETKKAQARVVEQASRIDTPIWVLQAEEDRLVRMDETQRLFDRLGSQDKKITLYPGLFHEIFNEPEGPEIIAEVVQWISHRAGGKPAG